MKKVEIDVLLNERKRIIDILIHQLSLSRQQKAKEIFDDFDKIINRIDGLEDSILIDICKNWKKLKKKHLGK